MAGGCPACGNDGYLVTSVLWIKAEIHTEEKGIVEAVWQEGGRDETAGGNKVIWGYFYASPDDVSWGSRENPDAFVKIWFDANGRIDVNYFHVSVPDIYVYADYRGTLLESVTTLDRRYVRLYYNQDGQDGVEENYEDGIPAEGYSPPQNPPAYSAINGLGISAVINTVDGPTDAVWKKGGDAVTAGGHQVLWGHFYADPSDVDWGSENNPDLFVKVWFDAGGRIDVNFFHVSVPDIEVYSDYPGDGSYDEKGTTIMADRYIRHEYQYEPMACENIDGNWSDLITGNITTTMFGETETNSFSGFRAVSVKQTDCDTEWNLTDSSMYKRTGSVKGNIVSLSGEMTNSAWFADELEESLKQEYANIAITFSTNTHSGEGTISEDSITYEGSGYLSGSLTYMGVSFDISFSRTENSTLTKTGSRSRTTDGVLFPMDSFTDFLVEMVRQKLGD
ncbi:hypothetical protein QUF72_21230 [Desulfobacterales bacterium HSG2]|nr:hypothetical protein [Desulfobacterales bacterium HSG2]